MNTKRCPECGVEYFAHVAECADCGVALVSPEAYLAQAGSNRPEGAALDGETVVLRKGEKDWMMELADVLRETGVSCRVDSMLSDPLFSGPSCKSVWALVVGKKDYQTALAVVEEYYRDAYPEVAQADSHLAEGRCPACASPISEGEKECPDCGLVLVIERE